MLLKRNMVSYQLWLKPMLLRNNDKDWNLPKVIFHTTYLFNVFNDSHLFFIFFFGGGGFTLYTSTPPPPFPRLFPTPNPCALSIHSHFLLLSLMTIGQCSDHCCHFQGSVQWGGEMCVVWGLGRRGGFGEVGGWGGGGGEIFTVWMMTPWKWRCQGRETVLLLEGAPSSLWLGRESMCCVCSQCGKQRLGLLPLPSPVLPLVSSWHLLDSCPDSYC